MEDYLFIEGLTVDCVIGFAPWERMVEQTVSLDLKLGVDIKGMALRDKVEEKDFNTKALSKRLRQFIASTSYNLIETLAEKTAALILKEFPVTWVELRLSKPGALRGALNVGVAIRRSKVRDILQQDGLCE